jgi:hypothetical protein
MRKGVVQPAATINKKIALIAMQSNQPGQIDEPANRHFTPALPPARELSRPRAFIG